MRASTKAPISISCSARPRWRRISAKNRMAEPDAVARTRLCNATGAPLRIWLEPCVDELWLPSRSELALLVTAKQGAMPEWPEIESSDDTLVIYEPGNSLMRVE